MSDNENGKGSERDTPKASSVVKEHARKMLAKLRAKLSAAQMRFVAQRPEEVGRGERAGLWVSCA
jgi:hypothetical protein